MFAELGYDSEQKTTNTTSDTANITSSRVAHAVFKGRICFETKQQIGLQPVIGPKPRLTSNPHFGPLKPDTIAKLELPEKSKLQDSPRPSYVNMSLLRPKPNNGAKPKVGPNITENSKIKAISCLNVSDSDIVTSFNQVSLIRTSTRKGQCSSILQVNRDNLNNEVKTPIETPKEESNDESVNRNLSLIKSFKRQLTVHFRKKKNTETVKVNSNDSGIGADETTKEATEARASPVIIRASANTRRIKRLKRLQQIKKMNSDEGIQILSFDIVKLEKERNEILQEFDEKFETPYLCALENINKVLHQMQTSKDDQNISIQIPPSLSEGKQGIVESNFEELYRLHKDIISWGIKAGHKDPTNLRNIFVENKDRIIRTYNNNIGKVQMILRIVNQHQTYFNKLWNSVSDESENILGFSSMIMKPLNHINRYQIYFERLKIVSQKMKYKEDAMCYKELLDIAMHIQSGIDNMLSINRITDMEEDAQAQGLLIYRGPLKCQIDTKTRFGSSIFASLKRGKERMEKVEVFLFKFSLIVCRNQGVTGYFGPEYDEYRFSHRFPMNNLKVGCHL